MPNAAAKTSAQRQENAARDMTCYRQVNFSISSSTEHAILISIALLEYSSFTFSCNLDLAAAVGY
jgi:hypothetical protein